MSGKLVGEVLDASARLQESGLPERAFHALVALAEKCHTDTRQGSVRWDHIRAGLYGASLSTAKRAVRDLKTAGLVTVIKRGFDNHHGNACAPIYRVEPLSERVTQVNQSLQDERVTQVTQSVGGERVNSGGPTGQIDGRTGHPGDPLDGSLDGSLDGGVPATAAPATPTTSIPEEGPSRKCPAHRHIDGWVEPNCRDCGRAKKNYPAEVAAEAECKRLAAEAKRAASAACPLRCDPNGFIETDDGLIRCTHNAASAPGGHLVAAQDAPLVHRVGQ